MLPSEKTTVLELLNQAEQIEEQPSEEEHHQQLQESQITLQPSEPNMT